MTVRERARAKAEKKGLLAEGGMCWKETDVSRVLLRGDEKCCKAMGESDRGLRVSSRRSAL